MDAASGLERIVYLLIRYRHLQDEILSVEFRDQRFVPHLLTVAALIIGQMKNLSIL